MDRYDLYVKKLKDIGDLNPLYVITFDNWIEEVLPELTLTQRVKILILTSQLNQKFNGD